MWCLENKKSKHQKIYISGYIQRRLDCVFIFNVFAGVYKKTQCFSCFSRRPVTSNIFFIQKYWKKWRLKDCGNLTALCGNFRYTEKIKNHIKSTWGKPKNENIADEKFIWNVWNTSKVSEKIPKEVGQSKRLCTTFLEIKLETLEPKISYHEDPKDIYCWEEVDKIHQEKTKFIILGVTVKDMNMAEIIWIFSKSWKKKAL